ncbi:hypothetical protein ABQE69_17080 [Mycolicibacillus trivialis]
MPAVVNSYRAGGLVLTAAALAAATAVAPAAPRLSEKLEHLEVQLTAGLEDLDGLLNVPVNLFYDIANIPYNLFGAPYSAAGLVPQFSALPPPSLEFPNVNIGDYPGLKTLPANFNGTSAGSLNNLANALLYTGSWWQSSSTNVWGWDTANPWNFTALINALIPIKQLSVPLADNLNTIMAAEFPIAEPANKFLFNDLLGELNTLFRVPLSDLTSGQWKFPNPLENPVGVGANPLGEGGTTYPEIWSGKIAHLDPFWGLGTGETQEWSGQSVPNFLQSLLNDPSGRTVNFPDLNTVIPTLWNVYNSFNADFSPFYLGVDPETGTLIPGTDSFLFQGAQPVYGIPNIINGIVNGQGGLWPDGPNILPSWLTTPVGDALNWLVGPNSAIAGTTVGISNALMSIVNQIELITGGPGVPGFVDTAFNLSTLLPNFATDFGTLFGPDAATNLAAMLGTDLAPMFTDLLNPLAFLPF